MKLFSVAAMALLAIAPSVSSATAFSLNFEKSWDFGVDVNGYYGGGTATDGTSGSNMGVTFTNVSGLSNDSFFTYYTGAPSPLGTAYAHTFAPEESAFLNVASGVSNALAFYYSSPSAIAGAIKAYSGVNGTGSLLGMFNLASNIVSVDGVPVYDSWTRGILSFSGVARSFDFTATANSVLLDDIATVPEPGTLLMMLVGATALVGSRRRS